MAVIAPPIGIQAREPPTHSALVTASWFDDDETSDDEPNDVAGKLQHSLVACTKHRGRILYLLEEEPANEGLLDLYAQLSHAIWQLRVTQTELEAEVSRARRQQAWQHLRRVAPRVGVICCAVRALHAEIHYRPGGMGARWAQEDFERCAKRQKVELEV